MRSVCARDGSCACHRRSVLRTSPSCPLRPHPKRSASAPRFAPRSLSRPGCTQLCPRFFGVYARRRVTRHSPSDSLIGRIVGDDGDYICGTAGLHIGDGLLPSLLSGCREGNCLAVARSTKRKRNVTSFSHSRDDDDDETESRVIAA
jgi:hypothetical protein